ncbi:MAG: CDP-diacylglycerol--serine O-phosphatidyltransferase [Ruminococcaceae bacterium]|nr:CDP-diacylglycerol--serine O-phosphatidyltransferase [Oscillospiraceae bacterium]
MKKFIGFYDYTVIITYLSIISAVVGMTLASKGCFTGAIICLFASGVCDAFDGMVARTKKNRSEDEKSFGIQLDSLCDVVSFGAFPAFLCYCMGANGVFGYICICLFALCAVIRLAFFNVLETKRQQVEEGTNKFYRGLPVTAISIIFPAIYLFHGLFKYSVFVGILHGMLLVVAFLFVLDFRVKKFDLRKLFTK